MAAARDDGSACGVGAAFRAGLSAVVILQYAEITDAMEARALSYQTDINHIYSNSWGPTDDGLRKEGPRALTKAAMGDSIAKGRAGALVALLTRKFFMVMNTFCRQRIHLCLGCRKWPQLGRQLQL